MKISLVSETITVIELTAEEMTKYDFTLENSDYSTPHNRKVLWSIIDDASRIAGKNVEVDKGLEIDFLPDIKGGCLLIISEGAKENLCDISDRSDNIFESNNLDILLRFSKALKDFNEIERSSLFALDSRYRLVIRSEKKAVRYIAGEFRLKDISSPLCLDSTREGFSCIIEEGALEILGSLAS